ncbi:MAG: alpha/beta fold hydrolase [Planctomycetes bacterium]|nr:alpha/beta fold hydrolase [Planctomycetota bacterium]
MTGDLLLRNRHGERLDCAFTEGTPGDATLVVIGHGVTANKDRPWLVALGSALATAGIASLRISFSGNGTSDGRFGDSTITKEVDDLGAVLDAVTDRDIVYAGHSMGGAVGVLRAAGDPRIRRLVSLAGMVHTARFCRIKFGTLVPERDRMWDKPECPLSQAFVDDLTQIDTVLPQARAVAVPWLLVHGTADTVVPVDDSREAAAAGPAGPELIELPGADHVFTGEATAAMCAAVVEWLAK